MKRNILLCLLSIAGSFSIASAQYADIRNPQTNKEIQVIHKQKVRRQIQYIVINGIEAPFGAATYDTSGRILSNTNARLRQHYAYDAHGRLISFVDSVSDGRRFTKNDYSFSYDSKGMPQQCSINGVKSGFSYDAGKKELSEQRAEASGEQAKRLYSFNEGGKLIREEFFTPAGIMEKNHKLIYNMYGDLASEITVATLPNGDKDSSVQIYTYDSKGNCIRKQHTHALTAHIDEDAANAQEEPETEITTMIHTYTYDRYGNRATENMQSSKAAENYRKEWVYEMNGLLESESTYDAANKLVKKFNYKYR